MSMKVNKSDGESIQEIMKRVSHADLLSHYLGITSLPVLINSPFRRDAHPSFSIYSPDGTRVLYKDHATGERGDIYSLLERRDNLSFSELIRKIGSEIDFNTKAEFNNTSSTSTNSFKNVTRDLKVRIRDWKDYDLQYWGSYGVSLKWLKYANVYPIDYKIIYKGKERFIFPAAKYAYVFVEKKEGKVSLKVYQPKVLDKKRKWDNSNDASVVGLWAKMPLKGDKIVICSSLKDALCLWSNTGIPAIYVQSETTGLSNTAQEELRRRFHSVFICFDNDAPGISDGKELAAKTGFKNIILPKFDGGKDLSDLYKAKGKEEFIKIVKPLFGI